MDQATQEQAQAVIGAQGGLLGKAQTKIGALTMEVLQLQMALEQAHAVIKKLEDANKGAENEIRRA